MTINMTKQVMIYNLEVEYVTDPNIVENGGKLVPVFRMAFGVENPDGFAEFIHDTMFKFSDLTISLDTQEEDNNG